MQLNLFLSWSLLNIRTFLIASIVQIEPRGNKLDLKSHKFDREIKSHKFDREIETIWLKSIRIYHAVTI